MPVLTFAALPDATLSVALHCKLDAGLLTYEALRMAKLATFTKKQAYEATQRLNIGVTQSMVYRGINQGVFFIPFSKTFTTHQDHLIEPIVNAFENEPSSQQLYMLATLDQIKAGLRARLHYRLIERLFPSRRDELPPVETAVIAVVGHDNPPEAAAQIQALVDSLTTDIERDKVQRKLAYEQRTLNRLLAMLNQHKITPVCWTKGVDFAAQFYRAIHERDPRPRSESEIALIVGRGRTHLDGLLARAGIESIQRPHEKIPLGDPAKLDDTLMAVYQRAKGHGQIGMVRSWDDHGNSDTALFTPDNVRSWVAAELGQGRKVEFTIHLCNAQQVVGEVKPRQKPERVKLPAPSTTIQDNTLQADDLAPQVVSKAPIKKERYVGAGYDPEWVRDALIKIYARSWSLHMDDPLYDEMGNDELIRSIIGEPIPKD